MEPFERPWFATGLRVPRSVLNSVDDAARAAHPEESCGLLYGPADDPAAITRAEPWDNLANKYHALDPETYPRTARAAYILHPMKMQRALEAGDARGEPVKVIFHSHCNVGAYFSHEDQTVAAPEGVPVVPVVYLVTSVRDGGLVDDHKLFAFDGGAWVERPLTVVEG
ncbi:MAG: Mov34/MPN/PAD-1 family protein [Myxococcales bacterium]|nr:Mov34/MPN/PAD-1 family protein [Myxococcales bacterium]